MMRTGSIVLRAAVLLATSVALAVTGCTSDEDSPVTPQVSRKTVTVTAGTGAGRLTSGDGKIDCRVASGVTSGPSCSATFDSGSVVTVTAVADADQEFTEWGGDCAGAAACQLSVTRDLTAAPKFAPAQRTFTLELATPNSDDGGLIIQVSGPNISGITPGPGLEMVENRVTNGAVTTSTLLIRGSIASGAIAQMSVRGVNADAPYSVQVQQAAARASGGYAQRSDLAAYGVTIRR